MKKEHQYNKELIDRAKKIKLLLMDCDGVLTDGRLYFTERGEEIKVFHVRDGQGLSEWHQSGYESGIISGRSSLIVKKRATELGIKYVKIGSRNKVRDLQKILDEIKVSYKEVAYVGDDIPDIPVLKLVGLPIAVADAEPEVLNECAYITGAKGGLGAIREVVRLILLAKKDE